MDLKYVVLMIAFATIEINVTESRQNDKRRWKNDRGLYNSHYVNICDIQDRGSKVHCYCESIKMKTATRADCWVFNGGIAEDDPFWSNFYSQPKIERLTFNVRADGGLTYIPAKVIIRLDRLQYLNIQYANIQTIPSFAFTNSTTLREITLSKNKITKLERMSFAHMIMLSNVSIVENQISELKRDVFYVLPNLQRLHLSKNSISVLHDGCFKHLNNLIELDLDSNLITVVITENFQGLSNLISLDMRNNKLTMIGDLAFAELWSLQELYLDSNEIEFISERGFGGLIHLRKLYLSDNKIANLNVGVFDDVQKLMVLDLRNNEFSTLSREAVENVIDNLKSNYGVIFLDGNKFTCDCRIAWMQSLRNETKSKRVRAALDRFTCTIDLKHKALDDNRVEIITTTVKNEHSFNFKADSFNDDEKAYIDNDAQDFNEDVMYEDTPVNLENVDAKVQSKVEYKKRLINIPFELLPCPHRLKHSKVSYSLPAQDEVLYNKGFCCIEGGLSIRTVLLLTLLLNLL